MRILLINSNTRDDLLAASPIGLSYVATAASRAGHETRVIDLCFAPDTENSLKEGIRTFNPEIIGVSIRNIDNANMLSPVSYIPELAAITRQIRELSDAPLIVGGSAASLCPREILETLCADYVVVSDGEETFVNLIDALKNGGKPEALPGLAYWNNGKPALNQPVYAKFASGNPLLGKWIDLGPYAKNGASYNVQTKRGCSQKCIYCSYNQALEGHGIRLRPAGEVVDEIEEILLKYKPLSFEFVDSVFNQPYGHCYEILEEILRRPWKTEFTAMGVSPKHLDRDLLRLMWRVGFRSFMISPETASPKMIANYGKGFTIDDLVHAAESINKTRFTVLYFFLLGGPGEDESTIQETIDFTEKYLTEAKRPPYTMANYYLGIRVYPNTILWDMAVEQGYFRPEANPLEQLWYISESLDLDRTVSQLTRAASRAPEISLGFDERYLVISKLITKMGDLFNMAKPYWRHYWGANRILVNAGLRSFLQPRRLPDLLRAQLMRQGYHGPLIKGPHS
jgi:radical SAM superfamily enzyme YgiQ (UPF0313 family)